MSVPTVTVTTEPTVPAPAPAATPSETPDEPFDRDRAMATIANLREYEKRAKALEKQLAAKTAADADAESKRLADDKQWQELAEKRAAEVTDVKRQLEARDAAERDRILRYEIRDAARDLGFIDPDDAYHLIDRTRIEFSDDGTPKAVAPLLKALAEKKPHLLSTTPATRGIPPTPRSGPNLSREEMVQREIEAQRAGRIRTH